MTTYLVKYKVYAPAPKGRLRGKLLRTGTERIEVARDGISGSLDASFAFSRQLQARDPKAYDGYVEVDIADVRLDAPAILASDPCDPDYCGYTCEVITNTGPSMGLWAHEISHETADVMVYCTCEHHGEDIDRRVSFASGMTWYETRQL